MFTPVLVIHGGAIDNPEMDYKKEWDGVCREALSSALRLGYALLEKGASSLEAITTSIKILEDAPYFDAGVGSVFTSEGNIELDASIMEGKTRNAGAVASVRTIKHPIEAARTVLEKSKHVLLIKDGAEKFAEEHGLEIVENSYFHTDHKWEQYLKFKDQQKKMKQDTQSGKMGTVGAVAVDREGNLAAGTSTGGLSFKNFGRVGDSPIIGAGTYAYNKTCAISCTGWGEMFIKTVVAYDISALMEYKGMSLQDAAHEVIMKKQLEFCGSDNIGGVIGVDQQGNIAMVYNTKGMYRGYIDTTGKTFVDIF